LTVWKSVVVKHLNSLTKNVLAGSETGFECYVKTLC